METNCLACEELKKKDANMIVNGWNDTNCASFKNDTGLKPSVSGNDCDDLSLMNDCLIGNMDEELERTDFCDWKDFMHMLIPNLWTMFEAIRCAICGLWSNMSSFNASIQDLNNRLDAMCAQSNYSYAPPVSRFGTLPNAPTGERRCGVIGVRGGKPLLVAMTREEIINSGLEGIMHLQDAGIRYGRIETISCSTGACQLYEWISPSLLMYKLSDDVRVGDILWTCTKAEALNVIGMTENLWNIFNAVGYTWSNYTMNNRKYAWIRLVTQMNGSGDEVLVMQYQGTSYPQEDLTADTLVNEPESPDRLYTTSC